METFYRTHAFLVEHFNAPVRRALMDNIDWSYRMIAVRGPRGVGRTSFLLQFAKEHFDPRQRKCLYINANNFYFQGRGIVEFAGETITDADSLNAVKAQQTPGDTVSIKVDRNGKTVELDIVIPQPTEVETDK